MTLGQALHTLLSRRSMSADTNLAVRTLMPHIERVARTRGGARDVEDICQLTLAKLARTTSTLRTDDEGGARAFLNRVVGNELNSFYRSEKRHRTHVLWSRAGEPDPVDRVAAREPGDDNWSTRDAVAEGLYDRLTDTIERLIRDSGASVLQRDLMWKRAQATLLMRVGDGLSAQEIAVQIGAPDASADCIHKWVERGRELVLQACDELERSASPEEAPHIAKLRDALAKRRTDAGKPRESRRTKTTVIRRAR